MELADLFNFNTDLEFCNFMDTDMNMNAASPMTAATAALFDPISSPEHSLNTSMGMSPVSVNFHSDDSAGFDTSNMFYTDTSASSFDNSNGKPIYSSNSSSSDETQITVTPMTPLTMLSVNPLEAAYKINLETAGAGSGIGDGLVLASMTPVATTVPTSQATFTPLTTLKTEPPASPDMLDIAATLNAEDIAVNQQAADKVPYSAKSSNGKIELKIISQPSRNHRARYRTEGSRGAIKDRSGRSFPIIKLSGYNRTPVKLRCYIGHDKRPGDPHLFYQVSKIVGKNVTPCEVNKIEGIKVIEIDLLPSNNMQAIINCVGIVKERNFDVQRKATNLRKKHLYGDETKPTGNSKGQGNERRSTQCTLVFGCQIPDSNDILQVVSDTINCAQMLGCPEVHKISSTRSHIKGGDEVFLIGKNFTRDTKITFECEPARWSHTVEPESEYINQNHVIVRVPAYTGILDKNTVDATGQVDVTFKLKCGDKYSEPYLFSYTTQQSPEFASWALK